MFAAHEVMSAVIVPPSALRASRPFARLSCLYVECPTPPASLLRHQLACGRLEFVPLRCVCNWLKPAPSPPRQSPAAGFWGWRRPESAASTSWSCSPSLRWRLWGCGSGGSGPARLGETSRGDQRCVMGLTALPLGGRSCARSGSDNISERHTHTRVRSG